MLPPAQPATASVGIVMLPLPIPPKGRHDGSQGLSEAEDHPGGQLHRQDEQLTEEIDER